MTAARVIVTRPAREAAHWVAQLGAHGISAAALPLIAIAPCTDPAAQQALRAARAQLAHQRPPYRALMFVSSNAVAHFFASDEGPLAPAAQALGATKTRAWAPGPGTACALLQAGIARQCIDRPAPEAAQFDSRALWQQVAAQVRPGDRVLIVHGRSRGAPASAQDHQGRQSQQGRDWLARQIGAAGGQVQWLPAYERSAPRLSAAELTLARQAAQDGSVWLLSSAEALAHLATALPAQRWTAAQALATHPRIAQAARAAGFGRVRECRPALREVLASIESAA